MAYPMCGNYKKGEKHHETCKDIKYQEITEHNQKGVMASAGHPASLHANILYSRN